MSANIDKGGRVRQLTRPAEPDERVTEDQVQDAARLARLLARMLKDLASLKRRWAPRRIDFEDVAVDATGVTKYRFPHGFRGRVRWWPIGWSGASASSALVEHTDTAERELVLVSHVAGTVSLRCEEAG